MIIFEVEDNVVLAKFKSEFSSSPKITWKTSLIDMAAKWFSKTTFFAYYPKRRKSANFSYGERQQSDIEKLIDEVLKDRRLVGIAKCHADDKFDLELGKHLAKQDLLSRYKRAEGALKIKILKAIRHDVTAVKDMM